MATAQLASIGVGIKNVLIATDFSHHSDAALRYGLEFAHLYGARVEIVYVVPTEEFVLAGAEALHAAREAARRDFLEFKSHLSHMSALVEKADYHLAMLEGPVADCLLQCAREKKADLLVVGTHGRSGLGKFILGSVAENVFRHSPVPVLTVGPNIHAHHEVNPTRHILAPCDLTPKSHPAVQYAYTLAQAHHAQLTVLHVVEHPGEVTNLDPYRVKQEIRQQLADIAGRVPEGVNVHYQVEFGKVAATILRVASESSADLIVAGVRPSSGVFDRFLWPIAYEVVREAACPVLTIRGSAPMN